MDLALNNLWRLICPKINQPTNHRPGFEHVNENPIRINLEFELKFPGF